MFDFLAFLAIITLFVLLMDTRSRLKRAEATLLEAARRIGALQRGGTPPVPEQADAETVAAADDVAVPLRGQPAAAADATQFPARSAESVDTPDTISAP
ncbi:MAG: hypothetical protein H2055_12870, partial [Sphingopyxis sp.]|nr:hypothetical protein [Sphingopyxis sp.]